MKTIFLSYLLLCIGFNLFAKEINIGPDVEVKTNTEEIEDMRILINCSYEKSIFGNKKYMEQRTINELMTVLCKDKKEKLAEIKFHDLKNVLKTKFPSKNVNMNIKLDFERFLKQEEKLNLELDFEKGTLFSLNPEKISFTISNLKNAGIVFYLSYSLENENMSKQYFNVIKNYRFDYINNKIELLELQQPITRFTNKIFSNTYNIDNITECINGKVWVKKYGAMSGEDCKWKEK